MADIPIHPRMAQRVLNNKIQLLEDQRATTIAKLEQIVTMLNGLARRPDCDFVHDTIMEYKKVINQLNTINPSHLPSTATILAMATHLQNTLNSLEKSVEETSQRMD